MKLIKQMKCYLVVLLLLCGCEERQDGDKPMNYARGSQVSYLRGIDNKLYIIAEKLERIAVALERR